MATARVMINPEALVDSVCVIIAPVDKMRDKSRTAHISRHPLDKPVEMDSVLADALKAEKALDKDGNEVPAVIDAPPGAMQAGAQKAGGDMTAADLAAGGKKQAAK